MSSGIPRSSSSFSLADLKSIVPTSSVKKEKTTPLKPKASAPKLKGFAPKRKRSDDTPEADVFEGLAPSEITGKLTNLGTQLTVGLDKLGKHVSDLEAQLEESEHKVISLTNLAKQRAARYDQVEHENDRLSRDMARMQKEFDAEREAIIENAKRSALKSVFEAMVEVAEQAASEGYVHSSWDIVGWKKNAAGKAADDEEESDKTAGPGPDAMMTDADADKPKDSDVDKPKDSDAGNSKAAEEKKTGGE